MLLILTALGLAVSSFRGLDGRVVNQFKQFLCGHWLLRTILLSAVFPHQNKGEFTSVHVVVVVHAPESAGVSENGNPNIPIYYAGRVRFEPLTLELEVCIGRVASEEQQSANTLRLRGHREEDPKKENGGEIFHPLEDSMTPLKTL